MTNEQIINLVRDENFGGDIRLNIFHHKTGVRVSFKRFMGYRGVTPEYSHITTYTFHRIQKAERIISILRNDWRLYERTVKEL